MKVTSDADQYELQLVAAQDGLVDPPRRFKARQLLRAGFVPGFDGDGHSPSPDFDFDFDFPD
jgi:hypothetical protein